MSDEPKKLALNSFNILNVATADPKEFHVWVSEFLMNDQLPVGSSGADIGLKVAPLLPVIHNKFSLATEMYIAVEAELWHAKKNWTVAKNSHWEVDSYASHKLKMESLKEILYRTMQLLDNKYSAASRMISAIDKFTPGQRF